MKSREGKKPILRIDSITNPCYKHIFLIYWKIFMQEFHIITSAEFADEISDQLTEFGALAITWLDAGNQPILEPSPDIIIKWQHMKIVALVDDEQIISVIQHYLNTKQNEKCLQHVELKPVPEKDWIKASRDLFKPMAYGKRLWICPSWHEPPQQNAINVLLDPGLAFGTGSHATTTLCLEWLDENIKGNETLIDYGCGSGILALAALKLGAKQAIAIDYDEQALLACRMNAHLNHLTNEQIQIMTPDKLSTSPVDIIIANILAKPLIELAPRFLALLKPTGTLVLSGILSSQINDILSAYENHFHVHTIKKCDDWVCIVLT